MSGSVEGTIVKKGVDDLELAALTFIARHRIPAYRPQPKQVVNISSTQVNVSVGHFTDEELETFERLLRKAGVPEHMINPAPVDVEAQVATEAQPSRTPWP